MKIGTAVIVGLLMVCDFFSDAVGADWVLVYSRSGMNFFYDRESIKDKSSGKLELDAKTTFETDAVIQEIIKERRSRGSALLEELSAIREVAVIYPPGILAHRKDHMTLSRMSSTQRKLVEVLEIGTVLKG